MKKISSLRRRLSLAAMFLIILCSVSGFGQSTANYTYATVTNGSLTNMSSGTTDLLATGTYRANVASTVANLGFTFYYMGVPYTQFSINSNGQMRLGGTVIAGTAQLPAASTALLAPISCGANSIQTTGKVHFKVTGTTPNQILIVEWLDLRIPASNTVGTFSRMQVLLYEANGKIEYVYGAMYNNSVAVAGNIFSSSSNTATTVGWIGTIITTPTYNTSVPLTTTTFAATSAITNLNSAADGSRRVFSFTPPAAPTAVAWAATPITNATTSTMKLNWVDNSSNETGFLIYNSTDNVNFTLVTTAAPNTTSYVASGLTPGTTYFWKLAAVNEGAPPTFTIVNSLSTTATMTFTSVATGNWSAAATWDVGQVPSSTDDVIIAAPHTVTIDAPGLAAKTVTVNGSLTYHATTVSALTVSGTVTVSGTGSFTSPASGTVTTHALNIGGSTAAGVGGDLVVNGIFNMNAFSTAGVAVTFLGTSNNAISGTGTTINFYTLTVNKGIDYTSILDVTSVITIAPPASPGQRLTITTGSFKLSSASTLTPYYGGITLLGATGRLWLNNAGATVASVGAGTTTGAGRLMVTSGRLQITAGTFSFGSGADIHSFGNSSPWLILEGASATLNLYGAAQIAYSTNFIMSAGNFNIYPQVTGSSAAGYPCLALESYFLVTTNTQLTGGTITIVDPPNSTQSSVNIALTNGTFNVSGTTFRFGNGVSDKAGTANGYSITSNLPLGTIVVNNSPTSVLTTRGVRLGSALTLNTLLTINSGTANQFFINGYTLTMLGNITNAGTFNILNGTAILSGNISNAGTITGDASGTLIFAGSTQQVVSGAGSFTNGNLANITINNTSGATPSVDFQIPVSVSSSLNLNNGTLGTTNASALTIGRSASHTTFGLTKSNGSLGVTPVFALGGVTTINYTYNAPTPAAAYSTDIELPAATQLGTFAVNNALGLTLDKAVTCTTLALTAGILNVTPTNSITVTGTGVANITGGSATAYVNGALTRYLPNNAAAANYKFPIGKSAYRLFEFQSITTGGTGTATFTAEAFDAGPYPGTAGLGLATINTDKMWEINGNLNTVTVTNSVVRITEAGMLAANRIGQANNFSGPYNSVGGVLGTGTISSRTVIDYSNLATGTYFRIGTQGAFTPGIYAIGPNGPYAGYAGWYPTFQNAADAASDVTLSGNVIFEFQDDYLPSVEVLPVTISPYMVSNVAGTVTFRPSPLVTLPITFSLAGTVLTNTGADYVIFDGRAGGAGSSRLLQFTNTATTTPTISLTGDAQNNQFLYCAIKGSNTTAASGILALSAPTTGNNNLTVSNCNFDGSVSASNCIYTTGVANGATITNNNFYDYKFGGGIYLASGSDAAIITGNSFYQTTTYIGTAGTTYGIYVAGTLNNYQISGNNIGGSGPNITGTWTVSATTPAAYNFTGIYLSAGTTVISRVFNNKVQNFDWKSLLSTFTGINGVAGNLNIGTDGANLIGTNTGNDNIKVTYYTTSGVAQIFGITTAGTTVRIENNNIGSITALLSGTTAIGTSITGINTTAATVTISGNVIGSTTTANSINAGNESTAANAQNVYGISSTSATPTISGNIVANINSGMTFTSGGAMRGIYLSTGTTINVTTNNVYSLSTAQPTTGVANLNGIDIGATGATTLNVTGNTIYDLVNTAASAAVNVIGIYFNASTTTTNKIDRNLIHSFITSSPSAVQTGFYHNVGYANFQNNVIRLGIDKLGNPITTTALINGIYKNSNSVGNFYFNTVYIGGSNVAAGAVSTYAFNLNTHSTEDIRNNIFINVRTNAVANLQHYVLKFPATALTTNFNSDYNIYNKSATDGKLAIINATDQLSMGALQLALPGFETHSGLGDPLLVSPASALGTMDLHPANLTPAEATGVAIPAVTDDFTGTARSGLTPVDMGAYAGNYTPPTATQDIFFPLISYTNLLNTGYTTNRTTVSFATISDYYSGVNTTAGTKPRFYFKKSTDANAFVGNTSTDNGWKWVEANNSASPFDFTIDYSIINGGVVVVGDVIQYFVVAQDMATTPNVSFSPPVGAIGASVGPTGMTAPTTPNSYNIAPTIASAVNVGTGYTFTSLTGSLASGGLFAAINAGVITTNVVATIKTDLVEPGTTGLNKIIEEGPNAGTLTVTIQGDGVAHVVSGSTTAYTIPLILIHGASRVTFDGGAKLLTFRNSYAAINGCGPVIQFDNGSLNCTVKNSIFESNSYAWFAAEVVAGTGTNSLTISGNDFRDNRGTNPGALRAGVYSNTATNSLTITNNNFYNFKTGFASDPASYGIYLGAVANGCVITGNSFYMETGQNPICAHNMIYIIGGSGHNISGNFIGGSGPNCTGTWAGTLSTSYSSVGIYFSGGTAPASTISGNTIASFNLTSSFTGFIGIQNVSGVANITGNTIGSASTANSIQVWGTSGTSYGIYNATPTGACNIDQNIIANMTLSAASGSPSIRAIQSFGGNVRQNKIFSIGVLTAAVTPAIYGIYNAGGYATNEYSNNLIALNGGAATNPTLYGFYDASATAGTSGFYFNSINLYGSAIGATSTYAFYRTSATTGYIVNNNILSNLRTGGTGSHYSIYVATAGSFVSNLNNFYTAGTAFGFYGVAKANFAAWQAIPMDLGSLNVNPTFTSNTDLHTTVQAFNNLGVAVTGITTDLANATRTNPPDIGVYEFTLPITAINTLAATAIGQTGATVNGNISTNNEVVAMTFEYGLTNAYGSAAVGAISPIRSTSLTATSAALTGLTPNSLYHYRIKGASTTSAEVVYGLDMTFDLVPSPTITGPATICQSTTGNVYTTQSGKSNYVWAVSAGGTITAGGTATDNTVTVTWGTAGAQTVSVNFQNSVGVSAPSPTVYNVTVIALPIPGITGNASACIGSTGNVYTSETGMSAYVWSVSAGGTITAGGTSADNTATITWNTAGAQSVSVNYANANLCTAVSPTVYAVTVNVLPVPTIGGNNSVCAGSTSNVYSTEAGKSAYAWTVSAGGTITSGGTAADNTVTVTWNTAGAQTVSVNYANSFGCKAAAPVSYNVTVNSLPIPTITGNNNLCAATAGVVYTTQSAKTAYAWSVSAGGTITSGGTAADNTVTVTWNTSGAQSVSVNYNNAAGCNATTPTVYNVTVNPLPVPVITGNNALCQGTTGVIYSTAVGMTAYVWTVSAGGTITAGGTATDNTVTVTWNTAGPQSVSVNYSNSFGCTAATATVYPVTINILPVPGLAGNATVCTASTGNVYTTEVGKSSYVWVVSAGGTITAGGTSTDNTVTVTWSTLGAQSVSVNYANSFGCSAISATSYPVNVLAIPTPVISGSATACATTTGHVYSTLAGQTAYAWTVSAGGTITAGGTATDNTVTITWNTAGAQSVSVNYTNAGGCSAASPIVYSVNVITAPVPVIAGTNALCAGSTGIVYSTGTGFTNYLWSVSAGGTITSGGTTTDNTATITWNTAGAQSVSANYTIAGGCSAASPTSYPVTVNALPVPSITGTASLCQGSTGIVYTTQAAMTAYAWTISAGGMITAGGTPTDNTATVSWNGSGAQSISVNYTNTNSCTAVSPTSYPVTVNAAPVPTLAGNNSVCVGSTGNVYTTEAGFSNYTWVVSAGGTITAGGTATSRTVTVTWTTAGARTVSVNYKNASGCFAVTPTVYNVTVNALPVPTISGPTSVCAGTAGNVYSTEASMTGYAWSVSTGGTITAGSGTNSITVTWNTAGVRTVNVNYVNGSGCTAQFPTGYSVTVNARPVPTITGTNSLCIGTSGVVYTTQAGRTNYVWNVSAGGTITAGGTSADNTVTVTWNTSGAQSVSVNYNNAAGCNATTPTVYNVTVNPLPAAAAGANRAICLNASTQIGATAVVGSTYSWVSVPAGFTSTTANPTVTPLVTTTYTVTEIVTATGCTNSNSVIVTVNPLPAAAAGANRAICLNASTQIGATAVVGNTYSWVSVPAGFTSTTANPTVTPLVTTTYTVTETVTASGCTNSNSVIVTVNISPAADFSASNLTPALNTTVTLTDLSVGGTVTGWTWSIAPATFTYVGGTTATSQNPQVQFTAGGLYSVTLTVTNSLTCSGTTTKTDYIRAGSPGIWTGATSTNWSDPTNWQDFLFPGTAVNKMIPAGVPNWPTVTGNLVIGGSLTLATAACNITVTGDVTMQAGSSISNAGTFNIQGNLTNQNAAPSALGNGTFIFNGSLLQLIGGQVVFGGLTVNNTAGISLSNSQQVNGALTFTNGRITLGTNYLTLGTAATIAGTPSSSSMVEATSTGELRKMFTAAGAFTFPVGEFNVTGKYTPATLTFTGGSFAGGAYVGVNLAGVKYPGDTNTLAYVKRYWNVSQTGISAFTCNAVFNYLATDVFGPAGQVYCVREVPTPTTTFDPANIVSHQLTANGLTTFGTFTGSIVYTPLTLTVYLQGLYAGGGLMNTATDITFGPKWGPTIADHITVEIHDAVTYLTIYKVINNVPLNINGTAVVNIPSLKNGSYYITVKHRNSIETVCATPQPFAGAALNYNFSNANTKAFGANLKSMGGGVFAIYVGDIADFSSPYPSPPVQDGIIDILDLYYIYPSYLNGDLGYAPADLNGDGVVDVIDLYLDYDNYLLGIYAMTP